MSLAKGVLGAMLGGVVAGALWIGVAALTGWEFTILAIVVGGAVGGGMGIGNKGRGGVPAGILAAVVAIVCILGAKLGVANMMAQKWVETHDQSVSMDDARTALMDHVYEEFESQGREMTTPDDEDGYPPEVWTEADRRWHAMSVSEREDYRAGLEGERREGVDEATGVLTLLAFVFSFGIFDLVCVGLAVSTAFKTASTKLAKEESDADEESVAQAPAMFRMAAAEAASAAATAPAPAAPPTPRAPVARRPAAAPAKQEQPTSGLGIFAMLGQEPSAAPAVRPAPRAEQPIQPPPPEEVGLINLDLGDERKAA